jgi:GTP-binding protein
MERYKKILLDSWEYLPPVFSTSALNNTGREEILNFIESTNTVFQKDQ